MHKEPPAARRELKHVRLTCDLAIIGGGMAGVCCAITAARAGIRVVLVQDRPVLGGNASSEVRLWILGATSHMGNNNRWARESGVIGEILVENLHRNREGNPVLVDALLLEKVVSEPNITLLLNTAALDVAKREPDRIESVRAFCSQNSTMYDIHAPLFCDASGDGIIAFLGGAAFRMGAESADEFDEKLAPSKDYGELLGHSIYFYTKNVGHPVRFVAPSFALKDITRIPRYKSFNASTDGCRLWWVEYGGRLDTVHDTEQIKWELWRIVYGVWDYIKNSGNFPEAENLTLEWVGMIPGKRESRRFEGPYILTQRDILEQRPHDDAVAFGGWSIDLHPADGVYSPGPGSNHWHARGVYTIPYRCLYSRNIVNLFLAGRIQSASHVAFGSTRVMATGAYCAQAAGMAAALCVKHGLLPQDLSTGQRLRELQLELQRAGQHIPGLPLNDPQDLARQARITASSELRLAHLPPDGPLVLLDQPRAQMLPVQPGPMPAVTLTLDVSQDTTLDVELRTSDRPDNFTPDVRLAGQRIALRPGAGQSIELRFDVRIDQPRYVFLCLMPNPAVSVRCSQQRLTGVLSLARRRIQPAQPERGVYELEFWIPQRRPEGWNFAITIDPPLAVFGPANVVNGFARPTSQPNAWLADLNDPAPTLTLTWDQPRQISRLDLGFDTDFDHAMESVLYGHPESEIPFCISHYRILDSAGQTVAEVTDNHQTLNSLKFDPPLRTDALKIELLASHGPVPSALMEVRCYGE